MIMQSSLFLQAASEHIKNYDTNTSMSVFVVLVLIFGCAALIGLSYWLTRAIAHRRNTQWMKGEITAAELEAAGLGKVKGKPRRRRKRRTSVSAKDFSFDD